MKNKMRTAFLVVAILATSVQAFSKLPLRLQAAQVISKSNAPFRDFVEQCRASELSFSYGECMGYVAAVSDWLPLLLHESGRGEICIPSGMTYGDLVKIVIKFGADHPEKLYLERGAGILLALKELPCKEGE